jgi:hypothetical protein
VVTLLLVEQNVHRAMDFVAALAHPTGITRGQSASKTRVNALLTRGSIFFARSFLRRRWIAPELGLARVPRH